MIRLIDYSYILGTVVFTVYGQLIIKWRIGDYGQLPEELGNKLIFLFKLLFDPYIFSGLVAAFVASMFWMAAMTRFDVSHAYPFITAGLTLITVIMAVAILGEPVTMYKVTGVLLIISGVIVMGQGSAA